MHMATRKPKAKDGQAEARALVDLPDLGVKAGELVTADPQSIGALVAAGAADPHPDAIAYAKAIKEQ